VREHSNCCVSTEGPSRRWAVPIGYRTVPRASSPSRSFVFAQGRFRALGRQRPRHADGLRRTLGERAVGLRKLTRRVVSSSRGQAGQCRTSARCLYLDKAPPEAHRLSCRHSAPVLPAADPDFGRSISTARNASAVPAPRPHSRHALPMRLTRGRDGRTSRAPKTRSPCAPAFARPGCDRHCDALPRERGRAQLGRRRACQPSRGRPARPARSLAGESHR
jgi:hypothetical protein